MTRQDGPLADRPLADRTGSGLASAVSAYGLWGLMPLYFLLLVPSGPVEIVAWRILLSAVTCVVFLTLARGWRRLGRLVADRRAVLTLGLASALIVVNWLVYVYASVSAQVVEAALGYFINPIVTVLLGVLVQRDRLRPLQWAAIAVSAVAVVVLVIAYGRVPWISLVLALSFGGYGLVKKRLGDRVDALGGLTVETLWLAAPAAVALAVVAASGALRMGTVSGWHTLATLMAGLVTTVPLLLFAAATRRLPLAIVGLSQYLTPVIQFTVGVALLGERMPTVRWIGFAIVWVALLVLTVDMLSSARSARRALVEPV
ncbi:MAG: EamA family transporter RarD [Microbacteriaceae bacterium]